MIGGLVPVEPMAVLLMDGGFLGSAPGILTGTEVVVLFGAIWETGAGAAVEVAARGATDAGFGAPG